MTAAKRIFGIQGATGCTVIGASEASNPVIDWNDAAITTALSSNPATFTIPNLLAVESCRPSCAAEGTGMSTLFTVGLR